jgi:phosphoserine phosphatase RsbU/P
MQRMIEQLLDLTRARLAAGIPVTLSRDEIDLAPLAARIVDEVRAAHPECMIDMRVDGLCALRIDPDRFEQVVANLLINAVTHGDKRMPIQVLLTSQPSSVTLSVQNQGPPIDPEFLPLLFNPFARPGSQRESSGGLGLGLYISERIVDAHGGKLAVQSSLDAGTRFDVILPRRSL